MTFPWPARSGDRSARLQWEAELRGREAKFQLLVDKMNEKKDSTAYYDFKMEEMAAAIRPWCVLNSFQLQELLNFLLPLTLKKLTFEDVTHECRRYELYSRMKREEKYDSPDLAPYRSGKDL